MTIQCLITVCESFRESRCSPLSQCSYPSLLCTSTRHVKGRAETVLRESYELSRGEHAPTLSDLRQRFGTELKQSDPCIASVCKYEIMLSNRALAKLYLSPYTTLSSSFWVRDDLVQENVLEL